MNHSEVIIPASTLIAGTTLHIELTCKRNVDMTTQEPASLYHEQFAPPFRIKYRHRGIKKVPYGVSHEVRDANDKLVGYIVPGYYKELRPVLVLKDDKLHASLSPRGPAKKRYVARTPDGACIFGELADGAYQTRLPLARDWLTPERWAYAIFGMPDRTS